MAVSGRCPSVLRRGKRKALLSGRTSVKGRYDTIGTSTVCMLNSQCRRHSLVGDDENAVAERTQEGREMTKCKLSEFLPSWIERVVSCV
jgi:hypothetical protein